MIRDYFRQRYQPGFKDGDCLYSSTERRLVRRPEACAALPPDLIAPLAGAANAPTFKGGGVNEEALPGLFRKWAGTGWSALLQTLPEETEADLDGNGAAAEEFRQLLRQVFLTEFQLGRTIRKRIGPRGQIEKELRIETRSLIDWCRVFAQPGPWRTIRSKQCWCKLGVQSDGEEVLRVAFRHGLLAQMRADPRLVKMPAKRFARVAQKYAAGRPGGPDERVHGRHVLLYDQGEVNDLIAGCPEEEFAPSEKGQIPSGGSANALQRKVRVKCKS